MTTGWADKRLNEAYDLVYRILRERPLHSESDRLARDLMDAIEMLDDQIKAEADD